MTCRERHLEWVRLVACYVLYTDVVFAAGIEVWNRESLVVHHLEYECILLVQFGTFGIGVHLQRVIHIIALVVYPRDSCTCG